MVNQGDTKLSAFQNLWPTFLAKPILKPSKLNYDPRNCSVIKVDKQLFWRKNRGVLVSVCNVIFLVRSQSYKIFRSNTCRGANHPENERYLLYLRNQLKTRGFHQTQ
ncbi:Hypothetical_protein [Hexamita inflata]|uniref:Hypothetical_protein n=1 Tax=Hexamita inflata TaxID=28002 RepID=A0AA86RMB8_9EUKA|nr:Hypothetical protein HINF_LOCUS65098 [Hexamita inflata]